MGECGSAESIARDHAIARARPVVLSLSRRSADRAFRIPTIGTFETALGFSRASPAATISPLAWSSIARPNVRGPRSSPATSLTSWASAPRSAGPSPQADDVPGAPAVAVMSHDYWTRRFNADPQVVGRQLRINAQPFTVVGVARAGFQGGESGLSSTSGYRPARNPS